MNIRQAVSSDTEIIYTITSDTISAVYPHYYPKGAVQFFLQHHSIDKIAADIAQNRVYIYYDGQMRNIGTVTVKENEINRLFVLPQFQGKGYGKALLNFAEKLIAEKFSEIILDASLPAKGMYLKLGYKAKEYHELPAANGDVLCYDVMKKQISDPQDRVVNGK